jgi:ribosomal protein L11 methyltransferase
MTTHLIRFDALTHAASQSLMDILQEGLDFEKVTIGSHEIAEDAWAVEVYAVDGTSSQDLSAMVSAAVKNANAPGFTPVQLDEADWVRLSLEGLEPVQAGRIFLHGGHDRPRVPANVLGIEIEAALAFGTGHHGTTLGCLRAFQELSKIARLQRVLDVGTGTGVLGMAAALLLKKHVLATDIDPVSVLTANANARLNGVARLFRAVRANGLDHPLIAASGPYDLVFANILAAPLIAFSQDISHAIRIGGFVILSGLLEHQIRAVSAAYHNRGFINTHTGIINGWAALTLQKVR